MILAIGFLLSEIYFEPNHNASAHCPHGLFMMWSPASTDLPPALQAASQQQAGTVCTNQSIDENHLVQGEIIALMQVW